MVIIILFYITLMFLNLFSWHIKSNSYAIQILSLALIIILMSGNTEGPDIINYIYVYSHQDEFQFGDLGYQFLEDLFYNRLHLSFFQFRYLITTFCFILIYSTLSFFKINRHLFIFLYMSYLFFMDTIQIRNFIVMAMFTFSFRYLLGKKKGDWIKFVIINLLATTIQVASIINILLLLVKVITPKKLMKICVVSGTIMFGISLLIKMFGGNVLMVVLNMVASDVSRGEGYYVSETHMSGLAILTTVVLGIYLCKVHRDKMVQKQIDSSSLEATCTIYVGNLIMLVFASTLLVNINFYRFYRNFLPLLFIDYTIFLDSYRIKSTVRKKYLVLVLFTTFLWYLFDIVFINEVQECVNPIFEHNILWEDAA